MKKVLMLVISLLLIFALVGCDGSSDVENNDIPVTDNTNTDVQDNTTADTDHSDLVTYKFPEGTVIAGVDVSGLLDTEAYELVSKIVSEYSLKLVVNDTEFIFSADDIGLKCSRKAVTDYFKALSNGEDAQVPDVLSFDPELITNAVSEKFYRSARNASVNYSSTDGKFKIFNESKGAEIDTTPVEDAVVAAVEQLQPEVVVTAPVAETKPSITADSTEAKNAVAAANEYLTVALTYSFTPDDGETKTETITKDRIASFIKVDGNMNVSVSSSAIDNYAKKLGDKYSVEGAPGKFIATGGYTLNINVTYAGQPVDTAALSKDIYNCVKDKISGTRTAPYQEKTAAGDMSFGGNYVEINMSAQCLWVYKNGECVASAPIVTGCVYKGWNTPTGVFSVNSKVQNTYLRGADYVSFVYYWIGFIGNSYGLHDATWRSEFGGDIYLYNGSHGCVNLPLSAISTIFNNVSIGTKVIIYGGATNAEPVQQVIKGTDVYNVLIDDAPFVLDAKTEYAVSKLSYTSSDSSIVSVSESGEVKINGIGTAVITVKAPEEEYYTSAEYKVTVNVASACSEGRHVFGDWVQVKAPTCAPGEETRKCNYCDVSENKSVAAVSEHTPGDAYVKQDSTCTSEGITAVKCSSCGADISTSTIPVKEHSFNAENEFCLHGCGTVNPNYTVPDSGEGDADTDNPDTGSGTESDNPDSTSDNTETDIQE